MLNRPVIFFILILVSLSGAAQDRGDIDARARKAYNAGMYQQSIEAYESILASGQESFVLYYNLGNAYFRANDIPSAILFYEKALKLEPNHPDIRHNIMIANTKITDKVELVPELFYKRWWRSFLDSFDLDTVATLLIIFLGVTLLFTGLYLSARTLNIRKFSFWAGAAAAVLLILAIVAAQQKERLMKNHQEAVVFTPTVTVKSSPDFGSKDLFVIHEGLKVTLLDKIGEWQEIKIANGSIGWLLISDIRNI